MDIRQTIRERLKQRGMTQASLAKMAEMTEPRVSDYLTGKRDVNADTLRKMLEALNLEIRPKKKGRR